MSAKIFDSDSFPKMTIGELIEVGKKFRPSTKALKKMSDEDLMNLMQNSWDKWSKTKKTSIDSPIRDDELPGLFKASNMSSIKLFRVLDEKEIQEGVDDSLIDGVTGGMFSVGQAGSSQGFRCLDYGLPTLSRLHNGARFWVIVSPESTSKLEKLLAKSTNKEPKRGCLGGASVLELSLLRKENIEFRTCLQRADVMVFTCPGVYYYWINLIDFTEVMSTYFTTDDWFEMWREREVERCSCRKTFTLNWAKMEAEGKNMKLAAMKADKEIKKLLLQFVKRVPENKQNSEQTTEDQEGEQISKDLEEVTLN